MSFLRGDYSDGDEFSSEDSFDDGEEFEESGGDDYAMEESGDKTQVLQDMLIFMLRFLVNMHHMKSIR